MLHLGTLGVIELADEHGRSLEPILRQPKRFAFLTYLVTRRPRPGASRERLLGLFWPELDQDHARNALNKTLHFLRPRLPEGILVNHGRTRVGIDPARVRCDAVEFRRRLADHRQAEALALAAGAFLPGLHIDGTPAFQEWLESERHWYRDRARGAGLELLEAELSRGRVRAALEWADVLERISPNDEEVVHASVRTHLRGGDRAAALGRLERYEEWLNEEMGVGVPATLVRLLAESAQPSAPPPPDHVGTSDPPPELLAASREAMKVETREEYRDFVDRLPDMAYRCDLRGSFPFVNDATVKAMGYSREELRNTSYDALVREDFRDRVIEFYVRQVDERIPVTYLEFPALTKDGHEVWVGQRVRLLERDGVPMGIQAVTRDITTRVRREKANRRTAMEDRETRLLNRDGFALLAMQRVRENRRSKEPFFVINVRLSMPRLPRENDDINPVSDAIRLVGGTLSQTVRESDVLGRISEDEVAILVPSGDQSAGQAMCARVRTALRAAEALEELTGVETTCDLAVYDATRLQSAEALMTFAWVVEE